MSSNLISPKKPGGSGNSIRKGRSVNCTSVRMRIEVVLILECGGTAHAEEILSSLPLVREKLITFELIPLKAYPGFARLFAEKSV